MRTSAASNVPDFKVAQICVKHFGYRSEIIACAEKQNARTSLSVIYAWILVS
jgi:hypothetical protein